MKDGCGANLSGCYFSLSLFLILFLMQTDGIAQNKDQSVQDKEKPVGEVQKVYITSDEMPVYPGGSEALYRDIAMNIQYPEAAVKANVSGRVTTQFVVQEDGTIGDVHILKGIGFGCDEEAIRVIKLLGKFEPGKLKGKPVSVFFALPIVFNLESKNEDSTPVKVEKPTGKENSNGDKPVFLGVEQMPQYKGGTKALYQFLGENIRYPEEATRANIKGRVTLQFIVEENGELSDVHVMKGIGYGCDEEAVRVVKMLPGFSPGLQNGKPVRVWYTLPVVFNLED